MPQAEEAKHLIQVLTDGNTFRVVSDTFDVTISREEMRELVFNEPGAFPEGDSLEKLRGIFLQ